jgi:hypothetical protein
MRGEAWRVKEADVVFDGHHPFNTCGYSVRSTDTGPGQASSILVFPKQKPGTRIAAFAALMETAKWIRWILSSEESGESLLQYEKNVVDKELSMSDPESVRCSSVSGDAFEDHNGAVYSKCLNSDAI